MERRETECRDREGEGNRKTGEREERVTGKGVYKI